MGLTSCGSMGSLIFLNSLWLIAVDPHRGGSISLRPKIVVALAHNQQLPHAVLALAQRGDTTPPGRDPLAEVQMQTLHKRRVALPAARREPLLPRRPGAKPHAMASPYQASPAHGFDDLRRAPRGPWHPSRFWRRA